MNLLKRVGTWIAGWAAVAGVVTAAVVYGGGALRPILTPVAHTFIRAWNSFQTKTEALKDSDRDNDLLRRQNLALKKEVQQLQFKSTGKQFRVHTEESGHGLREKTGTPVGRVLASIQYRPPSDLNQAQLLVLGASYLKANEDEKAAVVFSHVTDIDDKADNGFNTARNLMTAGMIWYRLDHLNLAEAYLKKSLTAQTGETPDKYHAQARLWLALLARRQKQAERSQTWLKDLLDHHPHSMEAQWVNRPESLSVMTEEEHP